MIHLDTHVVAWLFAGEVDLLSARAKSLIELEELVASPMVLLELQYLFEIGRTTHPGRAVVDDLHGRVGLRLGDASFEAVLLGAEKQSWTRDPFDRLIVGQAVAENASLLTKDAQIRTHFAAAVWD
ncbi:MAG: PIN domain-containing protein [Polyangiaceae bacterium]|nr:PIN domain-containing protein [Polyangiaceae bacterium]